MELVDSHGRHFGAMEKHAVDGANTRQSVAEDHGHLPGQAGATIRVTAPKAGETLALESETGATYLLDFLPEEVRFLVEGEDIVLLFDSDGDGAADSRIVFLELAGMAEEADAPILQVAGTDYDVSALLNAALALAQDRDSAEPASLPQTPAGPPAETAGGQDSAAGKGGGATQYQDGLGETVVSEAVEALSDIGAPTSAAGFSSGSVFTGLPLLINDATEVFVASTTSVDSSPSVEILAGQVVDGYIANATVFRDANENGELDEGEVFGTTDINGNFTLEGGSGPLIAVGGTDVSTGLAFKGVLKAPEGATVITPLTTLVQQLVEDGADAGTAESQVKEALGIDEGFDLNNTDPVAAAADGDTDALEVVKAGIQIANTAVQVTAALEGAGATDAEAASNAAFQAIAEKIVEKGTDTDLGDGSQIGGVLQDAAQAHQDTTGETTADDLSQDDIDNATSVIATTHEVVENIAIDESSDAIEVLTGLAEVAQVAQDDASEAIEQAVETDNDSAVQNFDDTTEIETAAENAEVGNVDGADVLDDGDNVTVGGDGGDSFDGLGGNDYISGGGGPDAIAGGAGDDTLDGGDGDDVLQGGAGDDKIFGGTGDDDIMGDAGSDTIDGGAGTDVVRFEGRAADYSFAGGGNGEILVTETASGDTDTLTNVEDITFTDSDVLLVGDGHPYETIQDAIDAAGEGDVILVADGSYGPITIDKSLTLLAIGDNVTITGPGQNQQAAIRVESGIDDVIIGGADNGFDINASAGDLAAIYLVGGNDGVVIEGNDVDGATGSALLTGGIGGGVTDLTVSGNALSADGPKAVVYNNGAASLGTANASSDVRVIDNTITGGADAGLLLGIEADDAVITGNSFEGSSSFANLEIFGADAVITGNGFQTDGFVPAIRDSLDGYDDDALIASNTFDDVAVPVLSPGAEVTIDADQLDGSVTALDISGLSDVSATFSSLGNLTEITTSSRQSIQLDGSQIDPISEANETLTIVGGAAVNIVNAGLVLPNDGTAPDVSNLLAFEFPDQATQKSLIPEDLTVDGSQAKALAAFWIPLDQAYVGAQDFLNLPINTSFVYLGNDYVRYLEAGGEALLDLVKVPDGRQQTLHDNLLGNLNDSPITSRFTNLGKDDPRTAAAEEFGSRPVHSGAVDNNGLYTDVSGVSGTIGWDFSHGIDYPNGLPAPFAVLDEANALVGTSETDYFYGGAGDDTMTGGETGDTAVYSGSRLDFDISGDADGLVTVSDGNTVDGDEGSDSLDGYDLRFSDGMVKFGAELARGVDETTAGGGNEDSDNFHPGAGNSNENFVIHDNTEARIEAAIKAKFRFQGDPESEGLTYFVETGVTPGSSTGLWNFDYSVVDYGAADISAESYTISIVADFTDIHGNTTQGVMVFDPIKHRADTNEDYYQDPSGATDGLQNSQNIGWYFDSYDASVPGSYDFVLTVRDNDSGEIVAQTEMRVEVAANITVGENGIATIQQAIDAAEDGDTILVPAGTYNEDLTIDKQITLLGAQSGVDPTDDGGRGGAETVISGNITLRDGADGTTIDGFTIEEGADIGGETAGIYLAAGAEDVTIENNVLTHTNNATLTDGARGVLTTFNGANSGLTIAQNSFTGWSTGVFINPGATGALVSGNDFDGNYVGMSVDGPDGTQIIDNSFANSPFEGLGLGPGEASPMLVLDSNDFVGNGSATDGRSVGIYDSGLIVTSDTASSDDALVLQAGVTDISLLGGADLSVIGNDEANEIDGNDGANRLEGGAGADTLVGGAGADTLLGGEGGDVIAYEDLLEAGDLIDGFDATGVDKIDVDGLFDALGVADADRAGRVEIQQAETDGDATILIDSDPGTAGFEVILATVVNVTGDLTEDDLILLNP